FGTLYLANLGAEVIKVEDISNGGDVGRSVGPYFVEGESGDNSSLFFQGFNHNKRSLSLNLSAPQGQEILHRLI
ncbi:CoA transferase, partial [Marinobacterium sedimentorum]|uniref:CoA transferase n=1 Tax=Marinobacterium sedimentorum TaxID=2927804 RepID=UPI0020C5BC43